MELSSNGIEWNYRMQSNGHFISRTPSLFLEGGYPELAL